MTAKDKYDPVVHVTAGELRANGIPVPEDIPDVGFVRRNSIKHAVDVDTSAERIAAGFMDAMLRFDFTEPFEWVEIPVPVEATHPCPACNGDRNNDDDETCGTCNGFGFIPAEIPTLEGPKSEPVPGVSGPYGPIETEADPGDVKAFLEAAHLASEYPQEIKCEPCGRVVAFARAHVKLGDEILAADVIRPDGTKPTDCVDSVCPEGCGGPFTLRPRGNRPLCLRCGGAGLLSPNEVDGKPDSCPSCHGTGAAIVSHLVTIGDFTPCPECSGSGRLPIPKDHELSGEHPAELERAAIEAMPCMTCNGSGTVPAVPPVGLLGDMNSPRKDESTAPLARPCRNCDGRGFTPKTFPSGQQAVVGDPCSVCKGKGYVDA